MHTAVSVETCIWIFIAALLIIIKSGNDPNVHQLMNTWTVVYSYKGILLSNEKEWVTDTYYDIGEPWKK